jgi:hypothetical protein
MSGWRPGEVARSGKAIWPDRLIKFCLARNFDRPVARDIGRIVEKTGLRADAGLGLASILTRLTRSNAAQLVGPLASFLNIREVFDAKSARPVACPSRSIIYCEPSLAMRALRTPSEPDVPARAQGAQQDAPPDS